MAKIRIPRFLSRFYAFCAFPRLPGHLSDHAASAARVVFFVAGLTCLSTLTHQNSLAQSDLRDEPQKTSVASGDANEESESIVSQEAADALIQQLGAPTFEKREQAVTEILRIGMPMVTHLRKATEQQRDPEVLLRARSALDQLTTGNFESRVTEFLSGKSEGETFEGWSTVEATLGDTPAIREIFVQILRAHPQLVASLDGTTRDRIVAVDKAAQQIQTNMFQNHQFPSLADGVALLLPLVDPGVTVSGGYEATLVSVLQKQMAALRRDASLWLPVSSLLDRWVLRSRIENRSEVLWYSMQWDLAGASILGERTLNETTDVETIQTAFQAIARFGKKQDAVAVAKFVEDKRPVVSRMPMIIGDQTLEVTVGDAALATIAVLYQVPLQDIGMKHGELHPKVGFIVDNSGFLPGKPDDRTKAIATVRGWLDGSAPPGKPRS